MAKALESGQCGLTSLNLWSEADSLRALSVSFGVSGRCVRWWMRMVVAWMAGVSNASLWLWLLWAAAAAAACAAAAVGCECAADNGIG